MTDSELDSLVWEKFGLKHFESRCVDEVSNDTYKKYHVDGILSDYDRRNLEVWESGKEVTYTVVLILNALCFQGIIKPGKYLVSYSW